MRAERPAPHTVAAEWAAAGLALSSPGSVDEKVKTGAELRFFSFIPQLALYPADCDCRDFQAGNRRCHESV